MNNTNKSSIGVLLCWWLILLVPVACLGCSRHRSPAASGAVLHPAPSKNLCGIRTLCIFELQNNTSYPQVSADVTESLFEAIQKLNLFDLSILKASDPGRKNLKINTDSPNNLEQLLAARKMLGVDSILIGTVTSYKPYPHMSMGLHLKLIDLREGRILWKMEQVWDTADKTTAERIKKYFNQQLRSDFSPLDEKLAILSPINFMKFVTYDVARTLEP